VKILVIDVGGSHVKILATGRKERVRIVSGPKMTPGQMVKAVKKAAAGWDYEVVSIGYPGFVYNGRPICDPTNLGPGWVGFDFQKAFGCPVRVVNDAAMQALGSYTGGRMLFLGFGTGLGCAMVTHGVPFSMEVAHLTYRKGKSFEEYVGERALLRLGKKKWRKYAGDVIRQLKEALEADYVVLGGGNADLLADLPRGARLGTNDNAFLGGFRLWEKPADLAKLAVKRGTRRRNEPE